MPVILSSWVIDYLGAVDATHRAWASGRSTFTLEKVRSNKRKLDAAHAGTEGGLAAIVPMLWSNLTLPLYVRSLDEILDERADASAMDEQQATFLAHWHAVKAHFRALLRELRDSPPQK